MRRPDTPIGSAPYDLDEWIPIGLATEPLGTEGPVELSDPTSPAIRAFYRIEVRLPED